MARLLLPVRFVITLCLSLEPLPSYDFSLLQPSLSFLQFVLRHFFKLKVGRVKMEYVLFPPGDSAVKKAVTKQKDPSAGRRKLRLFHCGFSLSTVDHHNQCWCVILLGF